MINKLDKLRRNFFIFLSITTLVIFFLNNINLDLKSQSYVLFFLVTLIGIPHGFFDFSVGKKLLKKFSELWLIYFIVLYVLISMIYFLIWIKFPGIALIFFLLIASYHFGYEEYNYLNKSDHIIYDINMIIRGIIIVFSPILFHYDQVSHLFSILVGYDLSTFSFSYTQKALFIILSIFHILFGKNENAFGKVESLIYLTNFILLPPLISFILYFCFSHSIKHFLESIYVSRNVPSNFSTKGFLFLIVISSLFFSTAFVILMSNYLDESISKSIIKFIFILLACLTLPHMIFNMIPSKR